MCFSKQTDTVAYLISCFHRALLYSIIFIIRLMHSIIQT